MDFGLYRRNRAPGLPRRPPLGLRPVADRDSFRGVAKESFLGGLGELPPAFEHPFEALAMGDPRGLDLRVEGSDPRPEGPQGARTLDTALAVHGRWPT